MKKMSLLFVLISIVLCSCQISKRSNFYHFDFFDRHSYDGSFLIQFSSASSSQESPHQRAEIKGSIRKETKGLLNFGTITFNDIEIKPDENNIYRADYNEKCTELYGTEVIVKIKNKTASFYLSKPIKFIDWEFNTTIHPNYTLKWNKDEKNKKDVSIKLTYLASHNKALAKGDFIKNKAIFIKAKDTGSYTFKKKDFEGIPNNAEIRISLARGGSTVMQVDDKKIELAGINFNGVIFAKANVE